MVLHLDETKNTPKIVFNPKDNLLTIVGKSFPENSRKAYKEVYSWIEKFNQKELTIDFYLYYISSSSIITLLDVLKKIEVKIDSLTINWMYDTDDDDIRKIGDDYKKILKKANFKFHSVEE